MATYTPQGFSNLGATPYQSPSTLGYTSPIASANTTQNTQPNWQNTLNGFLSNAQKNPIKSTTITSPDGGSMTHKYQTPIPGETPIGSKIGGGTINMPTPSSSIPQTPPPVTIPTTPNPASVPGNNTSGSNLTAGQTGSTQTQNTNPFPGLISQGTAAAQGNIPIGQNATDIANKYQGMINPILQNAAGQENGYATGMGTQGVSTGNAGVVQANAGNLVSGLTNQESQALAANSQGLTAQQQEQSGLLGNANATQPVMQFGQLTNKITGAPISGGMYGDNPQLQTAVSQAVQLASQPGADPNSPQIQNLLSTFGLPGQSLFTQAMEAVKNGTYNPTIANAQATTNASNISNLQTESTNTGVALKQIDAIAPVLTTFLSQSGMNPYQAQLFNGPVSDYVTKVGGSGMATQWAAQMGDLKNYTSQLLSSGYGGTPTGTEQATLSQDPSKLGYSDLQSYLQTLSDLGGNRKAVLDSSIAALGGSSGLTGAQTSQVTSTTPASTLTSPAGALAGGLGFGVGSWALNTASNLGGEIVGYLAKAATS